MIFRHTEGPIPHPRIEDIFGENYGLKRLADPDFWYEGRLEDLAREFYAKAAVLGERHYDYSGEELKVREGINSAEIETSEGSLTSEFDERREKLSRQHDVLIKEYSLCLQSPDSDVVKALDRIDEHANDQQNLKAWYEAKREVINNEFRDDSEGAIEATDALHREWRELEAGLKNFGAMLVFDDIEPTTETGGSVPEGLTQDAPLSCLEIVGPIGDICKHLNETAPVPQPMLALAATLTFLGAIFGRRYKLSGKLGTMTNVTAIGLARTGGGKDHARKELKKLLYGAGLGHLLMGDEVTSGAAIRSALERHPIQLCFYDEFGRELQALKSPNASGFEKSTLTTIMKIYSDSGSVANGKEYAGSSGIERKDIHCPSLSMWATTTPGSFYEALGSADTTSGLLNRFIVVEGDDSAESAALDFEGGIERREWSQGTVEWIQKASSFFPADAGDLAGQHIASLAPASFLFVGVSDPGAREILQSVQAEQQEHIKGDGDRTSALWARYLENTLKICMIVAIADNFEAPQITKAHAQWARDIVKSSLKNLAEKMRTHVADSANEREVNLVLNCLRNNGGWMSKSDLARSLRSMNGKRRGEILADLVLQGEVESESDRATAPPTVRYRITA